MRPRISLDQHDATRLATALIGEAIQRNVSVSVAVVDDAGVLLHFVRMDGARAYTVDLATRKARSAASVAVSTRKIDQALEAGLISNVESLGWGGVPVMLNGECAGAAGISGAAREIDDDIATLAVAQFNAP